MSSSLTVNTEYAEEGMNGCTELEARAKAFSMILAQVFERYQGDVIIGFAAAAKLLHGTDDMPAGRIKRQTHGPGNLRFEPVASEKLLVMTVFSNTVGMQEKPISFHESGVAVLEGQHIS